MFNLHRRRSLPIYLSGVLLAAIAGLLVPAGAAYAAAPGPSRACENADGRMESFYVADVTSLTPSATIHEWEVTAGGSTRSASLGGDTWQIFAPGCARNAAGQMHVFITGTNGQVYTKWQNTPNSSTSYSAWYGGLGAPPRGVISSGNVGAAMASTGKIEIFAISCDSISVCQMYTKWQTAPNGGWSGWVGIGGNFVNSSVKATPFGTGGARVRGVGLDGALWCNKRSTASSGWGGWANTGCNF
jgi:hypothetical protein